MEYINVFGCILLAVYLGGSTVLVYHHMTVDIPLGTSQQKPEPLKPIVLTTYLTSKQDPQRNIYRRPNLFSYMRDWYGSIVRFRLPAVVFHDELSTQFTTAIRRHSEALIDFQAVFSNQRSTNDQRFYLYLKYLEDNPNINYALMTDISDVILRINPFPMFEWIGENIIFVGRDFESFETMSSMDWMSRRVRTCFVQKMPLLDTVVNMPWVFNAGVIGGHRKIVVEFLQLVTHYLDLTDPLNVLGYTIYKSLFDVSEQPRWDLHHSQVTPPTLVF
eukprot:gene3210-8232_t